MSESTPRTDLDVTSVDVSAYTIPTELPEADGTLAWDKTTVVVVQVQLRNGGRGLGFAYGQACCLARVIPKAALTSARWLSRCGTFPSILRDFRSICSAINHLIAERLFGCVDAG